METSYFNLIVTIGLTGEQEEEEVVKELAKYYVNLTVFYVHVTLQ